MSTFYLVFEICALLAVIIVPSFGPKHNKAKKDSNEKSDLYVNEDGLLEYWGSNKDDHHPVI